MHEEDVFVTAGRDKQVSFVAKGDFRSDRLPRSKCGQRTPEPITLNAYQR